MTFDRFCLKRVKLNQSPRPFQSDPSLIGAKAARPRPRGQAPGQAPAREDAGAPLLRSLLQPLQLNHHTVARIPPGRLATLKIIGSATQEHRCPESRRHEALAANHPGPSRSSVRRPLLLAANL